VRETDNRQRERVRERERDKQTVRDKEIEQRHRYIEKMEQ
jgi:hypothetical protein